MPKLKPSDVPPVKPPKGSGVPKVNYILSIYLIQPPGIANAGYPIKIWVHLAVLVPPPIAGYFYVTLGKSTPKIFSISDLSKGDNYYGPMIITATNYSGTFPIKVEFKINYINPSGKKSRITEATTIEDYRIFGK